MGKIIKLTELQMQDSKSYFGIEFSRSATKTNLLSVDASRITTFGQSTPKKSSIWYRSDYPTFTVVEMIGAKGIHVKETPEEIEKLIS